MRFLIIISIYASLVPVSFLVKKSYTSKILNVIKKNKTEN